MNMAQPGIIQHYKWEEIIVVLNCLDMVFNLKTPKLVLSVEINNLKKNHFNNIYQMTIKEAKQMCAYQKSC